MLKNYLVIAIRNIARHKVYSFINIAGLAIGMACCALIMLYVQHELSYDDFHSKGDRIYRVLREIRNDDGRVRFYSGISGPFVPALLNDFPEVENAVRLSGYDTWGYWTRYEGKRLFYDHRPWLLVEPDFFTMFDFPFIKGDPKTALDDPGSMVITETAAKHYFGTEDPIGKIMTLEGPNDYGHFDLVVSGVIKVPKNTVFEFEMVVSATIFNKSPNTFTKTRWETWDVNYHLRTFQAYVLLREGVDPKTLEAKLPDFIARHMGSEARANNTYHLQPLKRMHLYTQTDYASNLGAKSVPLKYGNIQNVYLFSGVACLILLIACINFVNLSTARSANRAKEVGLRKVSGADRFQLIQQFIGEAILLSFIAFVLALGLVELALPKFSAFVSIDFTTQLSHLFLVPGLVTLIGLLAGCYPAFFLSAFKPVSVLKGQLTTGVKGTWTRKGLVVFQFAMSILLIIGTVMVYRQLHYMQHKSLGFNKEHVVDFPIFLQSEWSQEEKAARYEAVQQAFLAHSDILTATAYASKIGGDATKPRNMRLENDRVYTLLEQTSDENFLNLFQVELIAGRELRIDDRNTKNILINETAMQLLGWKDPLGKQLYRTSGNDTHEPYTIIGVVRDFHYQSLHEQIQPLYIFYHPRTFRFLGLKIRGENLPETIAFMEKIWKQFVPNKPFRFTFVDESLNQLYGEEMRIGQLVGAFALLAIFVACLGLFGLAAFTAEQRTKEIGVRKVMGASVNSIVLLLSKEFAKLVLIANVIAWPVAYFTVGDWLQNFAYRVDIAWWVFALAGVVALLIALGTVGYQALRAALSNPIEALRYE